jgi:hypothetical protein
MSTLIMEHNMHLRPALRKVRRTLVMIVSARNITGPPVATLVFSVALEGYRAQLERVKQVNYILRGFQVLLRMLQLTSDLRDDGGYHPIDKARTTFEQAQEKLNQVSEDNLYMAERLSTEAMKNLDER